MKRLKYLLVLSAVILLLFMTVSAKTINTNYSVTGATYNKNDKTLTVDENADSITIEAEIDGGYLGEIEKTGGKLTVSVPVNIKGPEVAYRISLTPNISNPDTNDLPRHSGTTATIELSQEQVSGGVKVSILILGVNQGVPITEATLSNITIECSPKETAVPTSSATPTATASLTPSPSTTPNATPRPTVNTNETTHDPYDASKRVTNAPPTMSVDLGIDEKDIATQVPESDTATPEPAVSRFNTDPAFGLVILFIVLILLLLADIAIIIWRKNMGFWQLINGGVARRKINDSLCDNPEDFVVEDAVEQEFITDSIQEKIQDKIPEGKAVNNFDIDLSKK